MSMKIMIAGYYGYGNVGDEAILTAMLADLKRQDSTAAFVVVSGNPAATRTVYGVESVKWGEWPEITEQMRTCSLVILGGGGLFNDYWGIELESLLTARNGGTYYHGIPVLAKLLGKPLMVWSVGVGPLNTQAGKALTLHSLCFADKVTFRDQESMDLARSLGVPQERLAVTADSAFNLSVDKERALELLHEVGITSGGPLLAVCIRYWDRGVEPSAWQAKIAASLDRFVEAQESTLVFVPFQNLTGNALTDDLAASEQVLARMTHRDRAVLLPAGLAPGLVAGILGWCRLTLGARLHSVILSAISGVPAVVMAYDPKVRQAMTGLGMQQYALELPELSESDLLELLQRAWNQSEQSASRLSRVVPKLKALAAKNAAEAISLVALVKPTDAIGDLALDRALRLFDAEKLLSAFQDRLAEQERTIARQNAIIEEQTAAIQMKTRQLIEIDASRGWKFLQLLWRLRLRIVPHGSRRETVLRQFFHRLQKRPRVPENSSGDANSPLLSIVSDYPKSKILVLLPSIVWKSSLFQRPQQLALAFAREGYLVFYCEPSYSAEQGLRRVTANLYACNVPLETFSVLDRPTVLAFSYNRDDLSAFREPVVIYDYIDELEVLPYDTQKLRRDHIELCKIATVVSATSERLYEQVRPFTRLTILCPNAVDYDHFEAARNPRLHLNAPADLQSILSEGRPIVGYYGALAEWFDYDLLKHAAETCPELSFLLIGPDYDGSIGSSNILHLPNIHWLGPRPYAELPRYLRFFDVATIPFKLNDITHSTSPLKLFEFAASGKPIVVTPMHESIRYGSCLVANTPDEYVRQLRNALASSRQPATRRRLERFASHHTWEARARQMLRAVKYRGVDRRWRPLVDLWDRGYNGFGRAARRLLLTAKNHIRSAWAARSPHAFAFRLYKRRRNRRLHADLSGLRLPGRPGLVSIVLPVYNGAALLPEALESILHQSYQDFELIAVDDGSQDQSGDVLDEYARRDSRVRVIHQENRRLPLALSHGFVHAHGQYLTWTSHDNRLKPDFLEKMVACLQAHPSWDMAYANLDIIDEAGLPLRDAEWFTGYQQPPGSPHIRLPADPAELNTYPNNYIGGAFLYRDRVRALLGDYNPQQYTREDYDYWMQVNALLTLKHVPFSKPLYEYRFHSRSLTNQDRQLRITADRKYLMALDDFRRDYYLMPLVWHVDVDPGVPAAEAQRLKARLAATGAIVRQYSLESFEDGPSWTPPLYLKLTADPCAIPPFALPATVLKLLLCMVDAALPSSVDDRWDVCLACSASAQPPALPRDRQGWWVARDLRTLIAAMDIQVRTRQVSRLEQQWASDASPAYRASAVVCVHQHASDWRAALRSLKLQTLPARDYEILIVDNSPNADITALEIEAFRSEVGPDIRLLHCPVPGLSYARNAALAQAQGEIVFFMDDDAVADPGLLELYCRVFADHPELGVAGGHILLERPEPLPIPWKNGWERYWSHFVTGYSDFTTVEHWWEYPWGANWCARRSTLHAVGGFRGQYGRKGKDYYGGEELVAASLASRLGYSIAVLPQAVVHHRVRPERFTLEHVRRTIRAAVFSHYQAQLQLYLPVDRTLRTSLRQVVHGAWQAFAAAPGSRDSARAAARLELRYQLQARLELLWRQLLDDVQRLSAWS